MRIAHASLPADDTAHVARVLAEILGGEALPFPPAGPGAFIVWSADEHIELQVMPRGRDMTPSPEGVRCVSRALAASEARAPSEIHLALYVDRPAEEIVAIAAREGWATGDFDRAGFFRSVEVWVENAFLVECFDREATRRYEAFMTKAGWRALLESRAV